MTLNLKSGMVWASVLILATLGVVTTLLTFRNPGFNRVADVGISSFMILLLVLCLQRWGRCEELRSAHTALGAMFLAISFWHALRFLHDGLFTCGIPS